MKVYGVWGGVRYEGTTLVGLFETPEKAALKLAEVNLDVERNRLYHWVLMDGLQHYAEKLAGRKLHYHCTYELLDRFHIKYNYDSAWISEYEVL